MAGHHSSLKSYLLIFAALMILLAATVLVAWLDFGRTWNILIAMTIAIVKATLVVLYFMHVRDSSRLTWVFVVAGFFWFLIMVTFTLADFASRDWLPVFGR